MSSLAEDLPNEINRVRRLQDEYKSMRGTPGVVVEPQIAMMEHDIKWALMAQDILQMLSAICSLKAWTA